MLITNKYRLPKSFIEMAQSDYQYGEREYRVTSLLKGLRETILERRHSNEIERDVSDMIWLLFGSAVHSILERQVEGDSEIKESRIKIQIGGYTLSGQFDLYDAETKKITDYKTASVWKIIFGDFEEWRRQLLIYAYMMNSIGFPVERGEIVALLKDHSKRDSKVKENYPELPVQVVKFEFTEKDFAEIAGWLDGKFFDIEHAETVSDNDLPLCTPDERFNSGDKFAVLKKGRKTALRVLDNQGEAEAWMANNGGDSIEVRPGEDKKCEDYCAVNMFCDYYLAKKGVNAEELAAF